MADQFNFHDDQNSEHVDVGSDDDDLTPTDGYFSRREHPQDVYVDEPATTVHKKELEAREGSQESQLPASSLRADDDGSELSTSSSPTRYTPVSPTRSMPDETTPLIQPPSLYDAPPPAYTADQPRQDAGQHTYQSMTMPLDSLQERRRAPFFAGGEPESMGRPNIGFDPERNLYRRPSRGRLSRLCSSVCAIFWAFVATAVIVSIWWMASLPSSDDRKEQPGHSSPLKPHWPIQCADGPKSEASFDFDALSSFSVEEQVEVKEFYGGIHGRISFAAAPKGQDSPIHVKVSMTPSEPYSIKSLHAQKSSHRLTIMSPELTHANADHFDIRGKPCLLITASIFVKPDITLDKLDVFSTNLEITLTDSFLATVDMTFLQTLYTRISSESKLSSRETRIKTGSSSVSGSYNLLDLLDVSTQSGSIGIEVYPKESSKDKNPAKLQCTSHSGSISVHMPGESSGSIDLPKRDYQTTIKSDVGSVSGSYIHGTRTELESRTGSINVSLLPYSADDYESKLSTTTATGTTYLDLKSPYNGTTIKRMVSSHSSQAGSLHLEYPQEWEGAISGSSTTGSLVLRGRDVIVDELNDGWVSKSVRAHKGDGDLQGSLVFKTLTGSSDVSVGDT